MELSTGQALDLIDELAEMGTAAVHLTGGEPLVRKDIDALIQRLRFHAVRVSLSSNGTLIPRRISALQGCSSVTLSLDGPPDEHDQNRAEGQVDEVLAALQSLSDAGIARKLTCLVTSNTTEASLDFVLEQGQRYQALVYFQPALEHVLATEEPNPVVGQAEAVRRIFEALVVKKAGGAPVGNSERALLHMQSWPRPQPLRCAINRFAVRVTPEGVLLPCHERAAVPEGERIFPDGFAAAFQRLRLRSCDECWGAGRVQLREAATSGPLAFWDVLQQSANTNH